jgi:hypothetical protein
MSMVTLGGAAPWHDGAVLRRRSFDFEYGRERAALAAAALCIVLAVPGCFRTTYRSSTLKPSPTKVTKEYDYFVLGLIGEHHVWPARECKGRGVARMASGLTAVDALLTVVTFGIYAPRTVVITCAR